MAGRALRCGLSVAGEEGLQGEQALMFYKQRSPSGDCLVVQHIRRGAHAPEHLRPAEEEAAPHAAGEPDPVARPQRARHHERIAARRQQDGGQGQALQAGRVLHRQRRNSHGGQGRATG